MKIVVLTDIHGKLKHAPAMAQELHSADLVLLPGDLTNFGRGDVALEVVETIRNMNPNVLAVMGNCDFPEVLAFLEENCLSIHADHRIIGGIAFAGLGGSLPCPIQTLNEFTEHQIAAYLDTAIEGVPEAMPLVLVSHQPPIDTLVDRVSIGLHVGSRAVREFIERRQPLVCFSGHIHEAIGQDTIGATRLINSGPFYEGAYAVAEIGDRVEKLEIRHVA